MLVVVLIVMLAAQIVATVAIYPTTTIESFSRDEALAAAVRRADLDNVIVSGQDWDGATVGGYLDRSVYSSVRGAWIQYFIHDEREARRFGKISDRHVLCDAVRIAAKRQTPVAVIVDHRIRGAQLVGVSGDAAVYRVDPDSSGSTRLLIDDASSVEPATVTTAAERVEREQRGVKPACTHTSRENVVANSPYAITIQVSGSRAVEREGGDAQPDREQRPEHEARRRLMDDAVDEADAGQRQAGLGAPRRPRTEARRAARCPTLRGRPPGPRTGAPVGTVPRSGRPRVRTPTARTPRRPRASSRG